MKSSALRTAIRCALFLAATTVFAAVAPEPGALRAGAARIDITPAADAGLPMGGYPNRVGNATGVRDALNVRAIVVDDGSTQAALVTMELISMSVPLWERITARIQQETGIPAGNVLMTAVHTHSAPALGGAPLTGEGAGELTRRRDAYVQRVENALVESVKQAKAALQPAKIGYGTGRANVNVNRRARLANGTWGLGRNPDGPSDKTVAVVKLENLAGEPFAILSNYGVHATVMGASNNQISSDLPGATSRYVEAHYKDKVVSPWTSGAGGDQAPIYDRNGTTFDHVDILGRILGEEVVRVAESIKTTTRGNIRVLQQVVSCPGKRTTQNPGPNGQEYKFEDTAPVPIRLSLLAINDIAFAAISGELLTNIGARLKIESPFARTMVVTHCNGSSGYIPDDAAYAEVSFEITSTRFKPGCAESAIVNGLVGMMNTVF